MVGRINQKMRTRRELLRGARELMQSSKPVTVAAAAKQVGISTATAYRYFSEPTTMQVEAVLEMDLNTSEDLIHQLDIALQFKTQIAERLATAHRILLSHYRQNEFPYRMYIAKSHEQVVQGLTSGESFQGHAIVLSLIDRAMQPLKSTLDDTEYRTAKSAIAALCAPEHFFALKDTCGVSEKTLEKISTRTFRIAVSHWIPV